MQMACALRRTTPLQCIAAPVRTISHHCSLVCAEVCHQICWKKYSTPMMCQSFATQLFVTVWMRSCAPVSARAQQRTPLRVARFSGSGACPFLSRHAHTLSYTKALVGCKEPDVATLLPLAHVTGLRSLALFRDCRVA